MRRARSQRCFMASRGNYRCSPANTGASGGSTGEGRGCRHGGRVHLGPPAGWTVVSLSRGKLFWVSEPLNQPEPGERWTTRDKGGKRWKRARTGRRPRPADVWARGNGGAGDSTPLPAERNQEGDRVSCPERNVPLSCPALSIKPDLALSMVPVPLSGTCGVVYCMWLSKKSARKVL